MFEEAGFDDDDFNVDTTLGGPSASGSSPRLPPTLPASPVRPFEQRNNKGGGKGAVGDVGASSSSVSISASGGGGRRVEGGSGFGASASFSDALANASTGTADSLRNPPKSRRGHGAAERMGYLAGDDAARLHSAGDDAYRFTCAPPTAASSSRSNNNKKGNSGGTHLYDETFASGDAWGSAVCRCMVCEMHVALGTVGAAGATPVTIAPRAADRLLRVMLGLPLTSLQQGASSEVSASGGKNKKKNGGGETAEAAAELLFSEPLTADVPSAVVLWDMDNFGFNHMKIDAARLAKHTHSANSVPATSSNGCAEAEDGGEGRVPSAAVGGGRRGGGGTAGGKRTQRPEDGGDEKVLAFAQNTIFWFFYGSCFSRRHDTTPLDYAKGLSRSGADASSLWGVLNEHSRLLFTPCGGHSQAADEVMTAIALGLFPSTDSDAADKNGAAPRRLEVPPFPVIIVTRDQGLNETVRGLAGVGTGASSVKAVRCVDPQATGGTFVPFWGELTRQAEVARREFALVTAINEGR